MKTKHEALINLVAGTVCGWRGLHAFAPARQQPVKVLKLYDIEASPYCRLVREVLTELNIDVMILPCPIGGSRFRLEAEQLGGKQQFPLLHDENTGTILYESADIINYLGKTYGRKTKRTSGLVRHWDVGSSYVASALLWRPEGVAGMKAKPSTAPAQPLVLYSLEASPFAKPVRARLCELEIPYLLRNTGKGAWSDMGPPAFRDKLLKAAKDTTAHRRTLMETTGKVQIPYLIDSNTGTQMYESGKILGYLNRTYGSP